MTSPAKPIKMSLFGTATTKASMSSSLESRVSNEFIEFVGTTTFAPAPSPTYRHSMTLRNDKLRVWLKDCNSKKQWLASGLDQTDYVDSTNAIPNATASNYVQYFHELLEGGCDDKNDTAITFQRHKGDVFRLEMTLKIQVRKHSRVATYAIDMEPISLDRVDVLESRMREMQQEMQNLRVESEKVAAIHCNVHEELTSMLRPRDKEISELKDQVTTLLETQDSVESTQLQATAKLGDRIAWGNLANGVLRVTNPGMYQVTAIVNHRAKSATATIQLFWGSECVQTANCGSTDGSYHSTCLASATRVPKNYELAVKCTADLTGTSYLILVRIGK